MPSVSANALRWDAQFWMAFAYFLTGSYVVQDSCPYAVCLDTCIRLHDHTAQYGCTGPISCEVVHIVWCPARQNSPFRKRHVVLRSSLSMIMRAISHVLQNPAARGTATSLITSAEVIALPTFPSRPAHSSQKLAMCSGVRLCRPP